MTTLTIRHIPAAVEKAIRAKAHQEHLSLNKAVVGMLEESVVGMKKNAVTRHHDLDWMCGMWDDKQAKEFQKSVARKTDSELWK
jgi:hypothetical protein